MTIETAEREALADGTRLAANYKGQRYELVVRVNGDGTRRYILDPEGEATEFKTPSQAGRHVAGGTAVNGWRFFGPADEVGEPRGRGRAPSAGGKRAAKKRPKGATMIHPLEKDPANPDVDVYWCDQCTDKFTVEAGSPFPEACPQGHAATDETVTDEPEAKPKRSRKPKAEAPDGEAKPKRQRKPKPTEDVPVEAVDADNGEIAVAETEDVAVAGDATNPDAIEEVTFE